MLVYIQWAQRDPEDWFPVQHQAFGALANRPVPTRRLNDNAPGYIQAICVQGVVLENWDHYGVEPVMVGTEPGIAVAGWNDDPEDGFTEPFGQRWTFLDPAPDPRLNGRINTRQSLDVYGPDWYTQHWETTPNATRHPWSDFQPPADVRHGVWQSDRAYAQGQQTRSPRRWEEWVNGA